MFAVLVSSFVVIACLTTIVLVTIGIRNMRRDLDRQILEDTEAGIFDPDYVPVLWRPRMDVPGKYPAVRSRSAKALQR